MKVSARVRVSGPLSSCIAGFATKLQAQGYTDLSLANQLRLAAHFSRWLARRCIAPRELTPELLDRYLALRRRTRTAWTSHAALAPLLDHLGLSDAVRHAERERSDLLERYRTYLIDERALSAGIRASYEATADAFLDGQQPAKLTRADVLRFVRRLADRPGLPGKLSALRSFLRYLHVSGDAALDLASTVPSAAYHRQASLPKALDSSQVRAVLASFDRRTTVGRRDYAVVVLMLRMGLRACEVAALTLDDIDWAGGELVVHGKGGSVDRLPLPDDVGNALVAHLRQRRTQPSRALFLRCRAPRSAAKTTTIVGIAHQALRRAGVPTGGGHRLRHTVATSMLRRGASLSDIAQVLRHRHVDTTAIYAKVDRDALRTLAQSWPISPALDRASLRALAQPWPGGAL
jgi:site-specific recombinase XerD